MADTIFTRALAQAAALQTSTQALAFQLRVPEPTLLRWMSGRAQMPLQAFHRLIALLVEHEQSLGAEQHDPGAAAAAQLDLRIGDTLARCPRCQGTQFRLAVPGTTLRMTSALLCSSCSFSVRHGELLAEFATEVVRHSRAPATARKRPAKAKVLRLARG
jgi:hypothetical protein